MPADLSRYSESTRARDVLYTIDIAFGIAEHEPLVMHQALKYHADTNMLRLMWADWHMNQHKHSATRRRKHRRRRR